MVCCVRILSAGECDWGFCGECAGAGGRSKEWKFGGRGRGGEWHGEVACLVWVVSRIGGVGVVVSLRGGVVVMIYEVIPLYYICKIMGCRRKAEIRILWPTARSYL